MSKTNCVNCGSAKDISEIKCPFCGTTYLDFTAIDFSSGDPVVCQFVMPYSDGAVISMTAIPRLNSITMEPDDTTTLYADGVPVARFIHRNPIPEFDISFIPVIRNNKIFTVRTKQNVD